MALVEAVSSLDSDRVRELLDEGYSVDFRDEAGRNLLHLALSATQSTESMHTVQLLNPRSNVIFMLVNAGVNFEERNNDGLTCLMCAVRNKDAESCDILLQCGADMHATSEEGTILLDEVFRNSSKQCRSDHHQSDSILQEVFKKYYPGLWHAVELRDICQVRRLTNLWCRTDLERDGKTLKELALDGGHEEIISLVYGIHDTMKLIHHILARNRKAVSEMLDKSSKHLQLDLRKMSERGAPILYYLIQGQDSAMIELFVKHGCHVYTVMRDEIGHDMPVLFSAVQANMSVDVIKSLLPLNKPQQEEMLYKLLYKGRTILEVALENLVSVEMFDVLVDRGGPRLVADRNQFNQSVRDVAMVSGRHEYADVIDRNVAQWVSKPSEYKGHRQALALYGWDHMEVDAEDVPFEENAHVEEFLDSLSDYQAQIEQLVEAAESGNLEVFHEAREFLNSDSLFHSQLSWDGRMRGDGLPLLHRAVLFNHPEIVKVILNEKPISQSVDTLFDQNHRTALHYAYASASHSQVRKLLLDNGCSEHVLDRRNKEPLDFRDKQDSELMMALIERLKLKNYSIPEPDPWASQDLPEPSKSPGSSSDICTAAGHKTCSGTFCEPNYIGHTDFSEDYIENDTDSEPEESQSWGCVIL